MTVKKKVSLLIALIPIIILIVLLSTNVYLFGDNTLSGSNQLTLLFAGAIAAILGALNGISWEDMLNGAIKSISSAMGALIILLLIGSLAGTWMMSGIVPTMIYYGMDILSPSIFLFASCIICAIVSLATGSSWSTIATIGIAMLGIGSALGINEGLIGGAIISGAYFGDKMSPLSDTTNLAPAMAGTDLISHIKYMMWTTIPSISITLIIFLVIGFNFVSDENQIAQISEMQVALSSSYNISLWSLLVPCVVIFMIIKKTPAIPALLLGTLLGGLYAICFQSNIITQVSGNYSSSSIEYIKNSYIAVMNA
jgi:NhaC family Na+:H+ antiporter